MVEDRKSKIYDVNMYLDSETELDVEAILAETTKEYHYDGKTMSMVDSEYVSPDVVSVNTKSFNNSHKTTTSAANKERVKKLAKKNRSRAVQTIFTVIAIVAAGLVMAITLYPQAQLSEISRDNSDLKDEITELKKEILDAKGNSDNVTDMDSIRAQAMALGMQDPNGNQVVNVPMQSNDRLITVASYDSNGIDDDALNAAQENLKNYYHRVDAAN